MFSDDRGCWAHSNLDPEQLGLLQCTLERTRSFHGERTDLGMRCAGCHTGLRRGMN